MKLVNKIFIIVLMFMVSNVSNAQFNLLVHNDNDTIVIPTSKVDSVSFEMTPEMQAQMKLYKTVKVLTCEKDASSLPSRDSTLVDSLQNEVASMKEKLNQVLQQYEKLGEKLTELDNALGLGTTDLNGNSFGLETAAKLKYESHNRYCWNSQRTFSWKTYDMANFVMVIDDANANLPKLMVICEKYGFPLSAAIIPDNLYKEYTYTDINNNTVTKSVKEICDEIVANGGEILCHSNKVMTDKSTLSDWEYNFVLNKSMLIDAGFDVRGIILAGGLGYVSKNNIGHILSQSYFDYGDLHGTAEPFYLNNSYLLEDGTNSWISKGRCWFPKQPLYDDAYFREVVDGCCKDKRFVVFATHGSDTVGTNTAGLEEIDRYLAIIKEKVDLGLARFTTWSYVYDTFGQWSLTN